MLKRTFFASPAKRAVAGIPLSHIEFVSDVQHLLQLGRWGLVSSMEEQCHFPPFEPKFSPAEFFKRSWIIKPPPNVPEDSGTIVVNLLLDALDQYLMRVFVLRGVENGQRKHEMATYDGE